MGDVYAVLRNYPSMADRHRGHHLLWHVLHYAHAAGLQVGHAACDGTAGSCSEMLSPEVGFGCLRPDWGVRTCAGESAASASAALRLVIVVESHSNALSLM